MGSDRTNSIHRGVSRRVLLTHTAGFSYDLASLTTYVFNPDEDKPTVAVAVSLSF